MANILHKDLTGTDLHEMKGAASAASGTVPISNGAGSTPFGFYDYNNLANKPVIPSVQHNGVAVAAPKIKTYTGTASSGLWSIAISGFTNINSVHATCLATGAALGSAAIAVVASISTSVVSGSIILFTATDNALGTNQTISLTVIGS